MAAQFIFTMTRSGASTRPPARCSRTSTSSFYPGAKIGVIGTNGSGKSTLLRIMAGKDDDYSGEARLTPGFTVGLLEQEPHLDENKDVLGNVMDGVGEVADLLKRYDEVLAGWSDPDADFEKLGAKQADLEAKIEAAGAWDLQRTIEIAMDALRTPPGDAAGRHPVRRREAPRRPLPAAAVEARPAAARRAHQPPRRRVGAVAGADPGQVRGHRRGRHPRPLLPRQRGPVDPRAGAGQGPSLRGQLLVLAGAEAGPPRAGAALRRRPPPHAGPRAGVGAHGPQGPPGQGQGPPQRLREAAEGVPGGRPPGRRSCRSRSRPASAWATRSSRSRTCARPSATSS